MINNTSTIKIQNLESVSHFDQIGNNIVSELLELFSLEKDNHYEYEDLIFSKDLLFDFNFFVMKLLANKQIVINPDQINKFIDLFKGFLQEHYLLVTESEKLYDQLVEKVFFPQKMTKKSKLVKKQMYNFQVAYFLVKLAFADISREGLDKNGNPERYFQHLKSVASIVLNELPNPNLNKVVIALLHDIQEDISGFNSEILESIFGSLISDGVSALSKKSLEYYLDQNNSDYILSFLDNGFVNEREDSILELIDKNQEQFNTVSSIIAKAKLQRQNDYFGHMGELSDDALDVKFADRIHNLRTIDNCPIEKQIKKIKETEKYFLNLALERNPIAYNLLWDQIVRIKAKISNNSQ